MKSFISLYVFFIVVFMHFTYFYGAGYDQLPWNVPSKISAWIAIVVFFYVYMEFFLRIVILGAILESVKKTLKNSTRRNIKLFAKHAHVIRAIYLNLERVVGLITTLLIIWILTNFMFLILNIYALLGYNTYNIFTFIILQSRTFGNVTAIALFLYIHDHQVKQKVSFRGF